MSDFPLVGLLGRLRRNHALEHATIHVLSQRHPKTRVVGRSTHKGFLLYGDLPTERVLVAAKEAARRLQEGQRHLAIHPSCGTNFVASGVLSGLGAFAVLTPRRRDWREWLRRLPMVFLLGTLGVILGQQLGPVLQTTVTTDPDVGQVQVAGIIREERGGLVVHRIQIEA
jgi:hypothetical protein